MYSGGCKSYMTGMYFGMLYCRSYGGEAFETTCAAWAVPNNAGFGSGALGSTHARTGQRNIGGSCCTSKLWLAGSGPTPPPSGDPSASSTSSDDKAAGAEIAYVMGGILAALGALYVVYCLGRRAGQPSQSGSDVVADGSAPRGHSEPPSAMFAPRGGDPTAAAPSQTPC